MDIDQNLTWEEWNDNVRETVTSLQVLGDQTGGFCICETNDFKEGIRAHRRGDERLLHHRLQLDEPGSAEIRAQD